MAMKKKAYTFSTKLQVVTVVEKTSKEAAVSQFSVDPRTNCGRSVTQTASDNFHIVQTVRRLPTTMLHMALFNKKALQ